MSKFTISRSGWLSLVALFIAMSSAARADIVTQVRDRDDGAFPPTMAFPGTNGVVIGTADGANFRDMSTFVFDLESNEGPGFVPFLSYCTEVDELVGFDTNPPDTVGLPFNVVALPSDVRFTALESHQVELLWSNAFADSLTSPEKAGAFQVILWDMGQDNALNLSAGNFQLDTSDDFTADVAAQANIWINKLTNGDWQSSTPVQLLTSPDSQDLVRAPEPASMALLILGGVAFLRRQRAA